MEDKKLTKKELKENEKYNEKHLTGFTDEVDEAGVVQDI